MVNVLLEMKNIVKRFPGVRALDNVNLEVEEGEIHALVGENGAGKSTLMNVLEAMKAISYIRDRSASSIKLRTAKARELLSSIRSLRWSHT